MTRHLNFDILYGAYNPENDPGHAKEAMEKLGITYQHATPQSMGDCWWFWNCENIPDPLPPYLSYADHLDPMKCIGIGLSQEDAEKIRDYIPGSNTKTPPQTKMENKKTYGAPVVENSPLSNLELLKLIAFFINCDNLAFEFKPEKNDDPYDHQQIWESKPNGELFGVFKCMKLIIYKK